MDSPPTLVIPLLFKDLMNNEQVMGYWKYILEDFEYYIPNHGYLLMIDSNFINLCFKASFSLNNILESNIPFIKIE